MCGFGYDESGEVSVDLKFANLPIVSTEACRNAVGFIPSVNQFCAGYSNGKFVHPFDCVARDPGQSHVILVLD